MRKLVAALVIAAMAMVPAVAGPILGLHTHSAYACGSVAYGKTNIGGVGYVVVWDNTCTGQWHTQTVSYSNNSPDYSAIYFYPQTLEGYTYCTGFSCNSPSVGPLGSWGYYGYGCVFGNCAQTPYEPS